MSPAPARTRVFVPLTPELLRLLDTDGAVPSPLAAFSVTSELRMAMPGADQEDLEYAALCDAADAPPGFGPGSWRLVAAADVVTPAPLVELPAPPADSPIQSSVESSIDLTAPLALAEVASFHVAEPGAAQDQELSWYDVSELAVVLALLR
jgi:hypothetical protein